MFSFQVCSLSENSCAIFQIEDTYGLLQCHPFPSEFVDTARKGHHCAFFMGLRRKQGAAQQERQQLDIRATVDKFWGSVSMYMGWKQGMDVCMSHVCRRQIPAYVFPNCVLPARPPRPAGLTGQPVSGSGACQSTQQQNGV
jgi:poly(A) polymerase